MVCQSIMSKICKEKWEPTRFYQQKTSGYVRVMGGCFVLGIGMSISGSGPTLLPTQVGTWVHNSWFVLIGCFTGALVFTILNAFIPLAVRDSPCPSPINDRESRRTSYQTDDGVKKDEEADPVEFANKKKVVLEDLSFLKGQSYFLLALIIGIFFIGVTSHQRRYKLCEVTRARVDRDIVPLLVWIVISPLLKADTQDICLAKILCVNFQYRRVAAMFEGIFHFDDEVDKYKIKGTDPAQPQLKAGWPPIIAGICVGVMQIPLRLITGDGQ
eukprot:gene12400-3644_t